MSVLGWRLQGGEVRNLLTHIRHRRTDTVGPRSSEPNMV